MRACCSVAHRTHRRPSCRRSSSSTTFTTTMISTNTITAAAKPILRVGMCVPAVLELIKLIEGRVADELQPERLAHLDKQVVVRRRLKRKRNEHTKRDEGGLVGIHDRFVAMNTATIRFFTLPLKNIPGSQFSGTCSCFSN